MAGIFVSYRRDDSAGHAGRLFDRLSEHFGTTRVFRDVDRLRGGDDFAQSIAEAIASCDACLVVIGRGWLTAAAGTGSRRLDDPEDFVRIEVATALDRGVLTIPVLVQGAEMFGASDLPEPLRSLARKQAVELSESRWDFDVSQLIRRLEGVTEDQPPGWTSWWRWAFGRWAFVAVGVVFLLVALGWAISRHSAAPPTGTTTPGVLLATPGVVYRSPQYSPRGDRLTFQSNRSGSEQIWVARADGTHPDRLTNFEAGIVGSPRWSPTGDRIAFDARLGGGADIWIASLEGRAVTQLTRDRSDEVRPSWSGDGMWIYFGSDKAGKNLWQVWRIRIEDGRPHQVTHLGGREAFEAPDGQSVFYTRQDAIGIWKVPLDGGAETRVLDKGRQGMWAVVPSGLLLLTARADRALDLELYSFATMRCSHVGTLPQPTRGSVLGLTADPAGKRITYAVGDDREQAEIVSASVDLPTAFEQVARNFVVSPFGGAYGRYGRYGRASPAAGARDTFAPCAS